MMVPIRLSTKTTTTTTSTTKATISNDITTNNDTINATVPILSAKILAIYTNNIYENDNNKNVINNDKNNDKSIKTDTDTNDFQTNSTNFSFDINSSRSSSCGVDDDDFFVDVEYLCDHVKENKILIKNRLVLSSDKGDPSILLSLFYDLIKQIATIVPSRYDLQQQMINMIESTLSSSSSSASNTSTYLYEVLSNHLSYQPKTELLPLLLYFINILKELQSLTKVIIIDRWIDEINELFLKEPVVIDDIILYLPSYFEKAMLIIEDIKYDVSGNVLMSMIIYYLL